MTKQNPTSQEQTAQTAAETATPAAQTQVIATETQTAAKPVEPVIDYTAKDFTIPEGVEIDAKLIDKFAEYAKNAKLPKEVAQGIVAMQAEHIKALAAQAKAEEDAVYAKWDVELKQIPNVEATLAQVRELVNRYGDSESKQLFLEGDLLKHPGTVRMLAAIAKRLGPDTMPEGSRTSPQAEEKGRSEAERMFGGEQIQVVRPGLINK